MSVAALTLSDIAAQTQSANLSASANGWQQFQDFLKSAIDQTALTETNATSAQASPAASSPVPTSSSLAQGEASEAASHRLHSVHDTSDGKKVAGSDDADGHHGAAHKTATKAKDAKDPSSQTTASNDADPSTVSAAPVPVPPISVTPATTAAATPSPGAGDSNAAAPASGQVAASPTVSTSQDSSEDGNSTLSQTDQTGTQASSPSTPPPATAPTQNAIVAAAAAILSTTAVSLTAAPTGSAKSSAALAATVSALAAAASASTSLTTTLSSTSAAAIAVPGAVVFAGRQTAKDNGSAAALAAGLGATGDAATAPNTAATGQVQATQPPSDADDGTASEQNAGDPSQSDAQSNSAPANANQGGLSASASGPAPGAATVQTAVNALLAQLQTIPVAVTPTSAAATATAARLATADGGTADPAIGDASGDASQATGGVGLGSGSFASLVPVRAAESSASTPSPYAPSQQLVPAEQVALAIGRLANGARSYSMQLNPEHLGTVDVRMDVDAKGKTKVSITADRPETLALLKLDSHHLVRALQDSGVTSDPGALSFSLREQGSNGGQERQSNYGAAARTTPVSTPDAEAESDATPVRTSVSRHLYDIRA